ncbi:hypothetical protein GCM10009087_22160 [Sphingomonas oligophenolica]|uniref:Apea-like HEPN domain-containing protein n=1 Tax=Sphingomonas oligophenolica TaxID=301154 RepID=A0ABU9Y3G5_9SPHN
MTIYFDRSALHPNGAKALNEEAEAIALLFESKPLQPSPPPAFETQREIGPTITEEDIIGEPIMSWTDLKGRAVGRYFVRDGQEVALRNGNYLQFRKLVEKVAGKKPFNLGLSLEFLEEQTFLWLQAARLGSNDQSLCDHLLDRCEAAVSLHDMAVPIASIEVERAFKLGNIRISPFDVRRLERWKTKLLQKNDADLEALSAIEERFQSLRKQLAGSTLIEVSILGEKKFVEAEAIRIADEAASVLRFLSPAAIISNLAFPCHPLGSEHRPLKTILHLAEGEIAGLTTGLRQQGLHHWGLQFADLSEKMNAGLRNIAAFFSDRHLTDHEQRVKSALLSYSRGVASYDPNERLIYAMFALEHLLLKDGSEPIQQNVGERIAFLIEQDPKRRKAVVSNFKKAYQLRSRYVHHLNSVENEEALQEFYKNIFVLLYTAIADMKIHSNHGAFLDHIDNKKFS